MLYLPQVQFRMIIQLTYNSLATFQLTPQQFSCIHRGLSGRYDFYGQIIRSLPSSSILYYRSLPVAAELLHVLDQQQQRRQLHGFIPDNQVYRHQLVPQSPDWLQYLLDHSIFSTATLMLLFIVYPNTQVLVDCLCRMDSYVIKQCAYFIRQMKSQMVKVISAERLSLIEEKILYMQLVKRQRLQLSQTESQRRNQLKKFYSQQAKNQNSNIIGRQRLCSLLTLLKVIITYYIVSRATQGSSFVILLLVLLLVTSIVPFSLNEELIKNLRSSHRGYYLIIKTLQ